MDLRMDRTAFSIGRLHDDGDEARYWWDKTPHQRLQAMELMRRIVYGEDAATGKLERVLEVVDRRRG